MLMAVKLFTSLHSAFNLVFKTPRIEARQSSIYAEILILNVEIEWVMLSYEKTLEIFTCRKSPKLRRWLKCSLKLGYYFALVGN